MKKNSPSKRLLSLLLCLALFLSLGVSSFAEARMESAPAVGERGTFKPAELREDGSPDGAASRTEEPEAAPQPDEPKADYAVFVYIVDDSTGAYPQHGTVSLAGEYQATPLDEYRYLVARGDTLTVSAVPDEGYVLDTETFRVTYRSSVFSSVDIDLPLDGTNAFTVPVRGVYSITIHATFSSIYEGYGISVSVLDLMGTGNTVTVDRDRAGEGDLVTVMVQMNEGTRFAVPGLEVYKNGDSLTHVDLTQVDDHTYTFIMPAFDVKVFAQFEFVEPEVYTISFPQDYSPVLNTLIYRNGEFQQGIIWDADTQAPSGSGWGNPGDTIRLDILSGGSYTVTGVVLHYALDGQPYDETLELTPDINGISKTHTSFVMPAADVSLELILTPFYRVFLGCNWLGDAQLSAREAFAGQEITLTAVITDPRYDYLTWTSVIFGSEEIVPYTVEKIDKQTYVLKITMPANAVTLGVEFSMEPVSYLSRNWNGSAIAEKQELCKLYNRLTESSAGYYTLTDEEYEGWWVLDRSVTLGSNTTLKIQGDVKLILCDGMTLHAGDGIYIADGSTLTIYGQAEDSGKIYAHPPGGAGIGGMEDAIGGNLIVHGGIIDAKGSTNAAGIGGGNENSGIRSVTINGGFVNAEGGASGAGIGKGQQNNVWEIVTINGGVVNATGGLYAAGIGGGEDRGNGTVIINGGTVTAKGRENGAGIGGGEEGSQDHPVIINGGTVTAEGGTNAAGIGGGGTGWFGDGGHGGEVTITGGTVTVDAGEYGAGIGGGAARDLFCDSGSGGTVTITGGEILIRVPAGSGAGIGGAAGPENYGYAGNGGNVEISGGKLEIHLSATRSAGIGAGGCDYSSGRSGSVSISGGETKITVTNGYIGSSYVESQGAGIGGASERSQGGDVTITGGVLLIENNGYGAGIGGGGSEKKPSTAGNGGNVYINTAFVVASSYAGAGIGGGGSLKGGGGGGNGGTVTVDGGTVYALSQNKGAGIGGGNDGNGGTLTVNGGYVMAGGGHLDYNYIRDHGLWTENIAGIKPINQGWVNLSYNLIMHFIKTGEYAGAGIGGGDDGNGGTVIINGGTVIAMSGMNSARACGHGDGGRSNGSVSIYDSAMVSYGRVSGGEPTILGIALTGNRESTCNGYAYARIEPCDHPEPAFTANETTHRRHCSHCQFSFPAEEHVMDEQNRCTVCGFQGVLCDLSFDANGGGGTMESLCCVPGRQVMLPVCGFTPPAGMCFGGWQLGDDPELKAENDVITPEGDLTVKAVWHYRVTVSDSENGIVTADKRTAAEGETVTLTVTPAEDCVLTSLTRVTGDEDHFTVIDEKDADGNYIFTMPAGNVTVNARFTRICTLSFDACGGTVEPAALEIEAGAAIGELPEPTREGGWVFLGWYMEPAASAFDICQATEVTAATTFTENTTVFAHWRLPGDVNGDGNVDGTDVTLLATYVKAGGLNVRIVPYSGDVSGDYNVDGTDVTLLATYVKARGSGVVIH